MKTFNMTHKKVAVSWSGGKDCNLALLRCQEQNLVVSCLVCFHPPEPEFRAHPIEIQKLQAESMGLPFVMVEVNAKNFDGDYKQAYAHGIRSIQKKYAIEMLVTGDIDFIGTSNEIFIEEVCKIADCGVESWFPLWKSTREDLIEEMLRRDLKIVFSCVKSPHFDETWIMKQLDRNSYMELKKKAEIDKSLDICGENGEYHTMVVSGPLYKSEIMLNSFRAHQLNGMNGQKDDIKWWAIKP